MKKPHSVATALLTAVLLAHAVRVDAAGGDLDTTFNPGTGPDSHVYAAALQSDGKIVIGGRFTSYNGTARNMVARVKADGSLDTTFNPGAGADNFLESVVVQADGRILIGGFFRNYNGTPRAGLARLNSDGSLDTTFDTGSGLLTSFGVSGGALAMAEQPDGKILVGGDFSSYNGVPRSRIARLNSDGSLDATFDPGTGVTNGGFSAIVDSIALQADGKSVIGGLFANYNGTPRNNIARLNADGSLDATFNPGAGTTGPLNSGEVKSVTLQPNARIVIGGLFDNYNGTPRNNLARLNTDGSLDTTFNPGTGVERGSFGASVLAAALQSDGKVLIVGAFSSYNGTPRNNLARLNSDGSLDATFNTGTGPDRGLATIAVQLDGKIIIGGTFLTYNGGPPGFFARLLQGSGSTQTSVSAVSGGGSFNGTATLTATLTSGGANLAGKAVSFRLNGTSVGTATTGSNGVATLTGVSLPGIKAGTYPGAVGAGFAGDATYAGSSNSGPLTVNKAATTTAVSSSVNPALTGQSVTFTATVTAAAGTPAGTVQFKDNGANLGAPQSLNASAQASVTTSSLAAGLHTITAEYGGDANFGASTGSLAGGQQVAANIIKFSAADYGTTESSGSATIIVQRVGDKTQTVTADYATSDGGASSLPCSTTGGLASSRCDFTAAFGTLKFSAGEDTKTFLVLVSQDNYVEGQEALALVLSNPTGGAALGTPSEASAALTIADDASEPSANPVDDARNFVRQHYHDFLNREPDASGWDFWTKEITSCASPQCVEVKRVNVSAAFYFSIEFNQTGFLVERMYKAAYGDASGASSLGGSAHQISLPLIRLDEFLRDAQQIGRGVVVGQAGWEGALEANKQVFALEFVQRARFTSPSAFPATLSAEEFVDRLDQNAGGVLSAAEKSQLVAELGATPADPARRAGVLRKVAENSTLASREFNRAFVLMQYFGYLRRDPDATPDADFTGYDFWLGKLEEFHGNYIAAEMVKAFINSIEYRQRFAQ